MSLRAAMVKTRVRVALRLAYATAPAWDDLIGDPEAPHVFVMLGADYGNLGDLAITRAQRDYLVQTFPGRTVVVVPVSQTARAVKELSRRRRTRDLVTLVGGGNTGDMYDDIQFLRELVITQLSGYPIISFPQTIEFSRSLYGRWAAARAGRAYRRHRRMAVMARDSASARRCRRSLGVSPVATVPDVVLTMADQQGEAARRPQVLLALRDDLERGVSDAEVQVVRRVLTGLGAVVESDTHLGDVRLTEDQARDRLDAYWTVARESRLVVTDRLHGSIFGVITGTPCVALDSGTGKVGQFWQDWFSDTGHVRLVRDLTELTLQAAVESAVGATPEQREIYRERFDEGFRVACAAVRLDE